MENKLTKKYGLFTAICMVVGIVIGSGVFFKGQEILIATKGNLFLSVLSWIIGGLVMIICSAQFAVMATKYEKVNGVIDYAESTCGKTFSYYLGWFVSTIYYPAMTSVLAWVSAKYFGRILGWDEVGSNVMILSGIFLILAYVINALSPKIAGFFQVSTTIIKLIPLLLMAFVGIIAGLVNGTLTINFVGTAISQSAGGNELFAGVCATAFAYEGWIIATSINSEIKNAKKNLPIALVFGALVVVAVCVMYNIAICGGASIGEISLDATAPFYNIFGQVGGVILNVLIVVSCLGTLNGLMLGTTRGLYSIAIRGEGPNPKMFSQIDEATNMPTNSSIFGLLVCSLWLLYFYGANLTSNWFGVFSFNSSELPVITIYAMYIPMIIMWMVKEKNLNTLKRFIIPILSIISCCFLVFVAIMAHGVNPYLDAIKNNKGFSFPVLFYLIIFVIVMLIGFFFSPAFKRKINK